MAKPITQEQFRDLWRAEFVRADLCGLCGNSGTIDTRGVRSRPACLAEISFSASARTVARSRRHTCGGRRYASGKDRRIAHLAQQGKM